MQVRFINRGTHGVVVLALDTVAGEYVALKFIERGNKVAATSLIWAELSAYRCLGLRSSSHAALLFAAWGAERQLGKRLAGVRWEGGKELAG
jgi:hypothetical protein